MSELNVIGVTRSQEHRCPLCGARFHHAYPVCGTCPMNAGCDLLKCPSCGYQYPRTSRIVEWTSRLLQRVARRRA